MPERPAPSQMAALHARTACIPAIEVAVHGRTDLRTLPQRLARVAVRQPLSGRRPVHSAGNSARDPEHPGRLCGQFDLPTRAPPGGRILQDLLATREEYGRL